MALLLGSLRCEVLDTDDEEGGMNGIAIETHPLISVHGSALVADAAQVMSDCSMGAVGVLGRDKQLVGIFTERDLAGVVGQHLDPFGVKLDEVVNDFPVIVKGPLSDVDALERMRKAHIRHLLVEEGDEIRIVSMRDLLIPLTELTADRGEESRDE